jgi:hypothetical protein
MFQHTLSIDLMFIAYNIEFLYAIILRNKNKYCDQAIDDRLFYDAPYPFSP